MTGCLLANLESQVPGGLTATIREAASACQLLVRSPLEFASDRAPRALLLATRGILIMAGSDEVT